jgi:hypothetical protein
VARFLPSRFILCIHTGPRPSWCAHCAPAVTSSPFSSQGTCDLSHVLNYNAFPSKSLLSFHPTALQRRIRAEWLCARQGSARRIGGAGAVAGKRLRGGGEEGLCPPAARRRNRRAQSPPNTAGGGWRLEWRGRIIGELGPARRPEGRTATNSLGGPGSVPECVLQPRANRARPSRPGRQARPGRPSCGTTQAAACT